MASEVKLTYHGVKIEYDEARDRWIYTLNGKERSSKTLLNAKVAIDRPDPKEEKFTPIQAYKFDPWSENIVKTVMITSVAESTRMHERNVEVWITDKWKKRSKVNLDELYEVSASNDATLSLLESIGIEEKRLKKSRESVTAKLVHVTLPEDSSNRETTDRPPFSATVPGLVFSSASSASSGTAS